jgi:hypothetical protein
MTPLRSPALADLQNALQLCVVYGDTKTISAESAQQQLDRIRGLIAQALAKLGEPNEAAIQAAKPFMFSLASPPSHDAEITRDARDCVAVVIHAALTGEVAGESWVHSLPCPICDGAAIIQGFPCESCKGTGMSI